MSKLSAIPVAAACVLLAATAALGQDTPDVRVSSGSPTAPFSQNKQNEPTIAIDANHPAVLVSGSNDNIDMEACNAGDDTTCPFTGGVGVSGVYFSFDSGQTWTQPTYTGWTARDCLGTPGSDPGCTPHVGSIGTLPLYFENGLVSDGDPAVAFGPKPANGSFSWANGSRLYYANLTANFGATRSEAAFKGFEAIAVSRTDDVQSAAAGSEAAWMPPVLVSHQASISSNGGGTWSAPRPVAGPVTQPGVIDPVLGRPVIDGVAGARSDLAPAPSVDIANGAPTGADATNRIVMSYVSGDIAAPHVYFTESTDGAATWTSPRTIETAGDRGYYTAPAISPNGSDVYVVYNAFTTPYRTDTSSPRNLVGVVLHADVAGSSTGTFSELDRGADGDPRSSSQNNLVGEFLGDYVYAAATRTYGAAVWNDSRNGADCAAMDAWRLSLRTGTSVPRPAPQQDCTPTFGNSDIFGGGFADPTP